MHKGFKCLNIFEGRVYISRDVVFDETVYPFATLHPNIGAHLRSEVLLLPSNLLNPSSFGDGNSSDLFDNGSLCTNPSVEITGSAKIQHLMRLIPGRPAMIFCYILPFLFRQH